MAASLGLPPPSMAGLCTVPLRNLTKYVDSTDVSRNMTEGERIVNSGFIVTCGITERSAENVKIFGLCLQTSALSAEPHVIKGSLLIDQNEPEAIGIEDFECSCKAGMSKKCKHICAILIFCNRNNVTTMTLLSSTDLKCVWSNQQKKQEMEKFEPVPIDMFCHVNLEEENYSKTYSEENLNELFENLLAATPNSAISKHRKGRMKINEIELDQLGNDKNNNLDTLIASAFDTSSELWNKASHIIRNGQNGNSALVNASVEVTPSEDELKFYHSDICLNEENCIKLCIGTIDQGNNKSWLQARSSRITGSTCYGFYTYGNRKGQNWDVKIDSFIKNRDNFKGNINTRYGQNTEPEARLKYENKTGYQVFECGLVVLPNVPWLGFSPDGIVFKEGSPHHLIEIKCPVLGKDSSIQHLIKTNKISYISEVSENQYELKTKHTYYGQCQLGLALTNLAYCDCIVYSKVHTVDLLVIKVKRDTVFIEKLIAKLHMVYFNHMLPTLYLQKTYVQVTY